MDARCIKCNDYHMIGVYNPKRNSMTCSCGGKLQKVHFIGGKGLYKNYEGDIFKLLHPSLKLKQVI